MSWICVIYNFRKVIHLSQTKGRLKGAITVQHNFSHIDIWIFTKYRSCPFFRAFLHFKNVFPTINCIKIKNQKNFYTQLMTTIVTITSLALSLNHKRICVVVSAALVMNVQHTNHVPYVNVCKAFAAMPCIRPHRLSHLSHSCVSNSKAFTHIENVLFLVCNSR